jgi:hypothetical protein
MYRAQVLLEEWQVQQLRSMSERQGRSVSELLREILTRELRESKGRKKGGLEEIAGIISDPKLSGRDHDEILYGRRKL